MHHFSSAQKINTSESCPLSLVLKHITMFDGRAECLDHWGELLFINLRNARGVLAEQEDPKWGMAPGIRRPARATSRRSTTPASWQTLRASAGYVSANFVRHRHRNVTDIAMIGNSCRRTGTSVQPQHNWQSRNGHEKGHERAVSTRCSTPER